MAGPAWVIGGGGFVGRRLVEQLRAQGQDVLGMDPALGSDSADGLALALDGAALPRLRALPSPGLVFHLAGSGSVSAAEADPLGDLRRTVESTAVLLEALRGRASRLVYVSSAAVYGDAEQIPIEEDMPCRPVSIYGAHKLLAEELIRAWGRAHGARYAIVRFFSIYGRGLRKQLPWDACHKLASGEARFGGTGAEQRDWLHVDDAAELLLRAGASADPALVMNGGTGVGTRVDQALGILAAELRGARYSFTGERRAGDPMAQVADVRRARSLGFEPRIAIAEGLADYARWFASL